MKSIPWSVVSLLAVLIAATAALVWEAKLDSEVFVTLVSAIVGGGLFHLGSASGTAASSGQTPPQ